MEPADSYLINWIPRREGGQEQQPQAPPRYPSQSQANPRYPGQPLPSPRYPGTPVVPQPRGFPPIRGRNNQIPQRGETRGRRGQPPGRVGPRPFIPPNPWAGQAFKIPKDVIMDHKTLNIACGDTSHGWNNHKCQYFGTPLFSKPCRNCLTGAHQHSLCYNKQVRNLCVYSRPGDRVWLPI